MLSTKQQRRQDKRTVTDRNRSLEAIVRLTGQTMASDNAVIETLVEGAAPSAPFGEEQQAWDEMVFAHRNKEYGAYMLRKGYAINLSAGLLITIAVVGFLICYPALSKFFGGDDVIVKAARGKLVYSELSVPPSLAKPKPIPPALLLPRLQKVLKFVPPKVVKEQVPEVPPTISEIRENVTGAAAVEGPADVIFDEPVEEVVADDNELFTVVDQQPEFEGGYEAMMAFIKQNMKYPANARRMQIEGTVHVSFIVSKTGVISDVKVLRGIMTECDREATRVVQLMPAWKPGKQNGRNVNVRFILPLKFRLN
jgi:periplasmic protein TonB